MRNVVDLAEHRRAKLDELVQRVARAVATMTPKQRAAMLDAQRRSWVRGEIGMGSNADEGAFRAAYRNGDEKEMARLKAESAERIKRSGL